MKRKGQNARASADTPGADAEEDNDEAVGIEVSELAGAEPSELESSTSTGAMSRRGRRSSAKLMRWPTRIESASEGSGCGEDAIEAEAETDFAGADLD